MQIQTSFADNYARARVLFLEGAAAAGMAIESHIHPLTGAEGETLAMDVARDGALGADKLLILSSGCHGMEGRCGSGIQVAATHDAEWLAHARAAGVAVLYIHALNPHGFSYDRRVTHENVDLNRNFQNFEAPLPSNPAYAELHDLLLPTIWPPQPDNDAAIANWIATHGFPRFQAAVTQGQHSHPDGLFFVGTGPTWSNQTLRKVLRHHGQGARQVAWIDVHTGLGPAGLGERIWAGKNDAAAIARANQWWGGNGATPITSFYDGSSSASLVTGQLTSSIYDECPAASFVGIAMEYGTTPVETTAKALRADHWLYRQMLNGMAVDPEQAQAIRQQMRDAFYLNTDEWRAQVITQGRQSLFQAVNGLSG